MARRLVPAFGTAELLALTKRDNWRNWFYIAGDWISVGLSAALVVVFHFEIIIYLLSVIWIGSRQRGLINLFHEGSHRKLFANSRLNDWATVALTGYPVMLSLSSYRKGHRSHHAFLWDSARDPDAKDYEFLNWKVPELRQRAVLAKIILQPLFRFLPYTMASLIKAEEEQRSESYIRAAFWLIAIAGLILLHAWFYALMFWIVPFLTTGMIIWYLAFLAEHGGLQDSDPYINTRGWTSWKPTQWLLAPHRDDLYHLVHHLYPAIPHYRLHIAHQRLCERVPEYRASPQCNGFFFSPDSSRPSVFKSLCR